MQRFDVGVILAVAEHPRNDFALFGDAQALVCAQRFDIDGAGHARKLGTQRPIVQKVLTSRRESSVAWYQDRLTWRACGVARRNWARPSGSRRKDPTSEIGRA